ncbi:MAG TPA: hypothetical protein VGW58_12715, partial [Pyrinomonadaceae bacterium]|nr:hypothetical protein [Pyrinomonadaceae bacterium]
MPFPRSAQVIAFVLTLSFLFTTPARGFQSVPGQSPKPAPKEPAQDKPKAPADAGKQKPDYSQEAVVVEQIATNYRFE